MATYSASSPAGFGIDQSVIDDLNKQFQANGGTAGKVTGYDQSTMSDPTQYTLQNGGNTYRANMTYAGGTPAVSGYSQDLGNDNYTSYGLNGQNLGNYKGGANDYSQLLTSLAMMAPAVGGVIGSGAGAVAGAEAAAPALTDTAAAWGSGAGLGGDTLGAMGAGSLGDATLPGALGAGGSNIAGMGALNVGGGAAASGGGLGSLFSGNGGDFLGNLGSAISKNPLQSTMLASSLYDMYARQKQGNAQMDRYNQVNNQINGMYAPGSPEYNLLAQKLQRSAAASGRNSQVGQFSTDLAGTIAGLKGNMLTQSLGNQNQMFNSGLTNSLGSLNSLFAQLAKFNT